MIIIVLLITCDQKTFKLKDQNQTLMAKWKKGLKEFVVSPTYDERRGCHVVIPKPIIEMLNKPEKFVFKISGSKVSVIARGSKK